MNAYHGSCHCGAVRFEVDADITEVMSCNCSRCHRLGWKLVFVPAAQFRLIDGEGEMTEYRFHTKTIAHLFCSICGIEPFGRGKGPDGSETVAINTLCLEDFDPASVPEKKYDGKAV
jgi:hypothetical protein